MRVKTFKIGDYVTFHTKIGYRTGIITAIHTLEDGSCPMAVIQVRGMNGKVQFYKRKFFKLKKVEL